MSFSIARTHTSDIIQAGRSGNRDTDRFPVDALLPCTTYPRGTYPPPPDHEIPDLAAMSDGRGDCGWHPVVIQRRRTSYPGLGALRTDDLQATSSRAPNEHRPPPATPPDRPPSRWPPPRVFPPSPAAKARHISQNYREWHSRSQTLLLVGMRTPCPRTPHPLGAFGASWPSPN